MWLWYGMYIYIVLVVIRQKPEKPKYNYVLQVELN